MEAVVDRVPLHQALDKVFIALDPKSGLSGYSNILFSIREGKLFVSGFSADMVVTTSIAVRSGDEGFVFALPGKTLKDIFRKINSDYVEFKAYEFKTSLRCGRATFKFNNLSKEFFPQIPQVTIDYWDEVPVEKFLRNMQKVSFSIANDDNRAALKSIHIDEFSFTASDGFRMALYDNDILKMSEPASIARLSSLKLVKVLKKAEGVALVGFSQSHLIVSCLDLQIICRLISIKYPSYRSILPTEPCTIAKFDKDDLSGALHRLLIVSDENQTIEFNIKAGLASLTTTDKSGQEFLDCDYEDAVTFRINGKFVLEAAERLDQDSVNIELRKDKDTGSGKLPFPIVIREDKYVNLIMPKRFEKG